MTDFHAHEAVRLPVELAVALVAGVLLAAIVLVPFVLVGHACPGARSGIWHVVTAGCADAREPCRAPGACR